MQQRRDAISRTSGASQNHQMLSAATGIYGTGGLTPADRFMIVGFVAVEFGNKRRRFRIVFFIRHRILPLRSLTLLATKVCRWPSSLSLLGAAGCVVLAFAGCQQTNYEIEMRAEQGKLHRQVRVWRASGGKSVDDDSEFAALPQEVLDRIASSYDQDSPPSRPQKYTFRGEFDGATPNDVGGHGWHKHWKSTLGSTSVYVERFRGNDDLLDDLQRRHRAADRLVDLAIAWAAAELEAADGYDRLRRFLDDELRHDLKNLSLYWWRYVAEDAGDAHNEQALVRIGQYLVEREYIAPRQLPEVVRAFDEANRGDPRPMLKLVQHMIAVKMETAGAAPLPDVLEIVAQPDRLAASLDRYLRSTEEFQRRQREWEQAKTADPDLDPPQPSAVAGDLLLAAFPISIFSERDRLKVMLAVATRPYLTNGDWDARRRRISWENAISVGESNVNAEPKLLFAAWSRPDTMTQESHFGRELLKDKSLAEYCLWYNGLSQSEAQQWDAFLSTLRPSSDLAEKLKAFRFDHEPPVTTLADFKSLADRAVDLIVSALGEEG